MKYLISIVSEQPVPNYLLIKELKDIDKYIFISTTEMERREISKNIYTTAQIPKEKRTEIVASNESLSEIKKRLNKLNLNSENEYYVNITGGTKIMSIAIWEYFRQFPFHKFYYFPINKNSFKEIKNDKEIENTINYNLSVKEYLNLYGIDFIQDEIIFNNEQVMDIFKEVESTNFIIDDFPKNKLEELGISNYNYQNIHTKWFEEYIYYKIKKSLNIPDESIKTGIKIYFLDSNRNANYLQNDNEIDVFFIYKNTPFIVEVKFSIGIKKINIQSIYNYLYKLSSINNYFGLRAKSVLMTLSTFENNGQNFIDNLRRKCQLLNVYFPFDRNKIISDDIFNNELKNFCK
jgi:hypothetical protein